MSLDDHSAPIVHCRSTRAHQAHAFTLVELLVVIGIVALLISILVPALSKARRSAQTTKCLSNLRQLGIGINLYQADHNGMFPPTLWYWTPPNASAPMNGDEVWDMKIAKYLGIKPPNPDGTYLNSDFTSTIYQCPSDIRVGTVSWGHRSRSYAMSAFRGTGTRFNDGVCWTGGAGGFPVKASMIRRSAETVALVEYWNIVNDWGNVQWNPSFAYTDGWLGTTGLPQGFLNNAFFHDKKLSALFCDGHVALHRAEDAYIKANNGGKTWWARK